MAMAGSTSARLTGWLANPVSYYNLCSLLNAGFFFKKQNSFAVLAASLFRSHSLCVSYGFFFFLTKQSQKPKPKQNQNINHRNLKVAMSAEWNFPEKNTHKATGREQFIFWKKYVITQLILDIPSIRFLLPISIHISSLFTENKTRLTGTESIGI